MAIEQRRFPRTSEATAAAELRDMILRGELAPGAKIRQEATAQRLGISLIPIREALKTLAAEGIVTYRPQRGYSVTVLPATAVSDMYVVRELLESATEDLALSRLAPSDLVAMRRHLRDQERAVQEEDAVEMIATNRRFHFSIFDRCDNAWLTRLVSHLWDTLDPYRVLSYRRMWLHDPDRHIPQEILQEHRRILESLTDDDRELSLELLRLHRQRSEIFLETLVSGP